MIHRDPQQAAETRYDLIVVGGGVYGISLTLEAARRGLRPLLLESRDFGGATSWNSLRILHGGLRYLQTLDLARFFESVAERRWFCQHFPDLVRPLPCLMPLYGRGTKRRSIFGMALRVNDQLSRRRNHGVDPALHLPPGRILSPAQTIERFPAVERRGLQGAGLWHDAVMLSPQRVLIEMLHWACGLGARALNHTRVVELMQEGGAVIGVRARDEAAQQDLVFHAPLVFNCTGPWSGSLPTTRPAATPAGGAANEQTNQAELFQPSLAFNVVIDRPPLSETALAVQPRRPGAPVYFMYPLRGRIFAGTVHVPLAGQFAGTDEPTASPEHITALVDELNLALPGMELRPSDVVRVHAGLLPVRQAGTTALSVRETIRDHGDQGGPSGLFSIVGVKFTTARAVAEKALRRAFHQSRQGQHGASGLPDYRGDSGRPASSVQMDVLDAQAMLAADAASLASELHRLVREEAVVDLDDLLYRRTDWLVPANSQTAEHVARRVRESLGLGEAGDLRQGHFSGPASRA